MVGELIMAAPIPDWVRYSGGLQLIPVQYQGIAVLLFMVVGFIVILYGFYLIASDPTLGNVQKPSLKKKGGSNR